MRRARYLLLLVTLCGTADARFLHRSSHRRTANLTLRRRLFTSPLITDSGNVDIEYAAAYDFNSSFTLPSALKYTPDGWQTEFSVSADTVASVVDDSGERATHLSDHLNFAATTAFHTSDHFDWAFAPVVSVLFRGDHGTRLGGSLIARYDRAGNTFSVAGTWTGATSASDTNPSGLFDFNGGYARRIKRLTPYVNLQIERATGVATQYSLFEGAEYEVNGRLAFDVSFQQYALRTGSADHQVAGGLTWTLYKRR